MLAFGNPNRSKQPSFLTTRLLNATPSSLTEIELYYDLECCWTRLTGNAYRSAELIASISLDGTNWVHIPELDATVNNVDATQNTIWLTDQEMDQQTLSQRNVGGIITLPKHLMNHLLR